MAQVDMTTEPSSEVIEPSAPSAQQPPPIPRRVQAVIAGWFFVWPIVFFVRLPFVTPSDTPEAWVLGAGSFLWFLSGCWIYGMLFEIAKARWRATLLVARPPADVSFAVVLPRRPRERAVMTSIVSWFFGWPFLVAAYFPPPGDTREAGLLGAGSLLWFLSCYRICVIRRPPRISFMKIIVGCFFGWPAVLVVCGRLINLIEHPYWLDLSLIITWAILWATGCYAVYDILFMVAEKRWPAAKTIREIVSLFIRMLVRAHHHAP